MASVFEIRVRDSGALARLQAVIPGGIQDAMTQIVATLKSKVRSGTPVGIRYRSFGTNKKGKVITRVGRKASKGAEHRIGCHYKGKWIASGVLKKSWRELLGHEGNTFTAGMETDVPYAGILESGGYRGIGKLRYGLMGGGIGQVAPRTEAGAGGIYSSRAIGGILAPIRDDVNWQRQVVRTIADRIFDKFKAQT